MLSITYTWCNKWRFIINPSKSNVVHYRNPPKVQTGYRFSLGPNGPKIEISDSYKYLGVYLDQYLTFQNATEILSSAAGRALGGMINKYRNMREMGYNTYSKLFESLVCPVMDYGAAIWGGKSYDSLNNVFNRAQRFFTGVHRLCPIDGFTGDMGWPSNRIRWKLEAVRLWNRLIVTDKNRLLYKVFRWDMACHNRSNKSSFASRIKQILCESKLKPSYRNMNVVNIEYVKKCLMDNWENEWKQSVSCKTKLKLYESIKQEFGIEKYLLLNIDKYEKSLLSQLRYGILPLRIETGRYNNEKREERICTLCETDSVESVEHFLFDCSMYDTYRIPFMHRAQECIDNWDNLTQNECLKELFSVMPRALGKYVKEIYLYRRSKVYK